MTANLFDAGDAQRLERERNLTEQRPRQPIQEDRSPSESILAGAAPEPDFGAMIKGLLMLLAERNLQ